MRLLPRHPRPRGRSGATASRATFAAIASLAAIGSWALPATSVWCGQDPAAFAPSPTAAIPRSREWIYFTDKGPASFPAPPAAAGLSERALRRRAKALGAGELVGPEDLPLYVPYVAALESLGVSVAARSKWLNAVSAVVPPGAYAAVSALPFVARIEPVRSSSSTDDPRRQAIRAGAGKSVSPGPAAAHPGEASDGAAGIGPSSAAPLPDYGPSFAQIDAVRVPGLHAMGITGRDVLVGFLDTGFRWRAHSSLSGRRVLDEWDFVAGDHNTANEPGDPAGEDRHGTLVFSTLGGYAPGSLVGPAFDAEFLLAKTEYEPTETPVEEDYWAAGMEWLEANGADVVNSSLGYDTWDDGSGYSWGNGDFDGKTSVVAKAAARAARLGVFLSVAIGNEGNGDGIYGTLLTPADADTAVSVGAATTTGLLSTGSSTGPTSDGRTKPDLIAPGVSVYCASTSGTNAYTYQSGTSLASPLAAGAAALLLSARPELTPVEVRDLLRASADTARAAGYDLFPNNFTGWGYLDAAAAVLSAGPVFSNRPSVRDDSSGAVVSIAIASAAGIDPATVVLWYRDESTPEAVPETLAMVRDSSVAGLPGAARYSATIPPRSGGSETALGMTAADSAGRSYASPPAARYDRWVYEWGPGGGVGPPAEVPLAMRLFQNYPNPFNAGTSIVFDLPVSGRVSVRVFNVLGQQVAVPFDGVLEAGTASSRAPVVFDGAALPSGLYLCRLSGPSGASTAKMLLVR